MQKIVPHLWYDTQAVEAAKWYVSIFDQADIASVSQLHDTPSGDVDTVEFSLGGVEMSAISAGPYFELNSAISMMVTCRSAAEVDALYAKLGEGASILMPLDAYSFSKRYVWLKDRFGVSLQIVPANMSDVLASLSGEAKQRYTEAFLQMKKLDIAALQRAAE